MRIILKTCPNSELVPFEYHHYLVGVVHKWLERNQLHGQISLYSFSWLLNGNANGKGFSFSKGATWFISFHDETYIKQIIRTILKDPSMFCGMSVVDVKLEHDPIFHANKALLIPATPIFIKHSDKGNYKHYTYADKESAELMQQTLRNKMSLAGMPDDPELEISFDSNYPSKKIRLISYKRIKNKASLCPVLIKGKPETIAFARNVGIGNSTGIGFGAIY